MPFSTVYSVGYPWIKPGLSDEQRQSRPGFCVIPIPEQMDQQKQSISCPGFIIIGELMAGTSTLGTEHGQHL